VVVFGQGQDLLFLVETKQKQIPLPHMRDRDDNRQAFFIGC
jgi:hypothetical protein